MAATADRSKSTEIAETEVTSPPQGKTLDFIVIGAQRAGTTSMWMYLRTHPQLYLPPNKEISFFAHDMRFKEGLAWYLEEYFSLAPADALWGTASPHYMVGTKHVPVETVADRMHDLVPDVKLIALLRDPIERAFSEYRLITRRGIEPRTFSEAMRAQLGADALEQARRAPSKKGAYLVQGEYGRILELYLERFAREQLLVLGSDDLRDRSERTMRRVFKHLGVDRKHVPSNLDKRYHRGGSRRRVSPKAEAALKEHLQEYVWPRIPDPRLSRDSMWEFYYWFRQWNIVPDDRSAMELDPDLRSALEEHYRDDAKRLRNVVGFEPSWVSRWNETGEPRSAPPKPQQANGDGSRPTVKGGRKARRPKGARAKGATDAGRARVDRKGIGAGPDQAGRSKPPSA